MPDLSAQQFVLGIDLGSNSLGWAMIALIDGEPHHLIRAGVRVFDAGMEGDIASGREESRNLKRRQMRLQRRQTWRRKRRLQKIFNLLQSFELLPPQKVASPQERQDLFNCLDLEILASPWFSAKAESGLYPEPQQVVPYILRAAALDEKLPAYYLGRAFYHLAQRRGFATNRKQGLKKGEDEGVVKEGIAELRSAMGGRTLGEYFSNLAPSEERIRCRWTARDMYESEFAAIWSAQAKYHPDALTESRKKELRQAMFYQRPLWFDPQTIGKCQLEIGERRAPAYLLASQRFRLLDKMNNLEINGVRLTPADRAKLIDELQLRGDLTFKKLRKLLGLGKDDEINLERGGEQKLPGNRTFATFYEALGQRWLDMSAPERDAMVQYVYAFANPAKLAQAAQKKWSLEAQTAGNLAEISFEPDYLNLSAKAMQKLLPCLEQGMTYGEARKLVYPESFESTEPKPLLPPVQQGLEEIRNPAVMRSLTELRKVVNAIVRQYGKPAYVRIELARDMKKSKKQRVAISENNRRNEVSRAKSAKKIVEEAGVKDPKPWDIRKAQLWEECGGVCPYTGKSIPFKSLFGPEPQFDIEHIIPFSISMDNSFQNLTLCYVPENRNAKTNQTPYQAYSGDPQKYAEILERAKHFNGERAIMAAKLKRFEMDDENLEKFLADFRDRQLNDTAYASSLAARYVGLLFGGINDAAGTKRVYATSGRATADFRSLWQLNGILNDGPSTNGGNAKKERIDHRHHAVDAVVIALTDAAMVKRLSDAAQRAPAEHRRKFASLQAPWPTFVDSIRAETAKITVSHRVSKKVSGPLHEETIYSPPKTDGKARVRKPLANLTKSEVTAIADKSVRKLVLAKLQELSVDDCKKAFSSPENFPRFPSSGVVIKKTRITNAEKPALIGTGARQRFVVSGNNHHVEIYAEIDGRGNETGWEGEVVSMREAYQRVKRGQPIIQREHGPLVTFKLSLAKGDTVALREEDGQERLYVVRKLGFQISLIAINDARKITKYFSPRINGLFQRSMKKLSVNPIGEACYANE